MNQRPPIQLPRPNLGPELPAPDSSNATQAILLVLGIVALLALGIFWGWRRRRASKRALRPGTHLPMAAESVPLATRLRAALTEQFGPAWSAYTTEEIAASPELADRFGEEVARRLVGFLRSSDRRRFSASKVDIDPEDEAWTAQFLEFVVAEAGTTSMINGK